MTPLSLKECISKSNARTHAVQPQILPYCQGEPLSFQETIPGPPALRHIKHEIKLNGSMTKARPIYNLTPAKDDALRAHLADSLEKGLICASKPPYSSAVFFVAKKDGSLRLVMDYRALNEVTIKNRYSLPLIDELFNLLGGFQYFSKIDLTAGYSQIRVKEEDIPKNAFRTKYGLFECVVLNFGMTNAPSTFVTYMNEVFAKHIGKHTLVYLNDIIV